MTDDAIFCCYGSSCSKGRSWLRPGRRWRSRSAIYLAAHWWAVQLLAAVKQTQAALHGTRVLAMRDCNSVAISLERSMVRAAVFGRYNLGKVLSTHSIPISKPRCIASCLVRIGSLPYTVAMGLWSLVAEIFTTRENGASHSSSDASMIRRK